jgi:hypothetical protein
MDAEDAAVVEDALADFELSPPEAPLSPALDPSVDWAQLLRNLHPELARDPSTARIASQIDQLDLVQPARQPRYVVRSHPTPPPDSDVSDDGLLPPPTLPVALPRLAHLEPCRETSLQALVDILNWQALQDGYWLVNCKTTRVADGVHGPVGVPEGPYRVQSVMYACTMHRRRPRVEDEHRKRRYKSAKSNCSFKILLDIFNDGTACFKGWTPKQVDNGWKEHNHGFLQPTEIAQARRQDPEQTASATAMIQAGLTARRILPQLRQDFPDAVRLKPKDVYNLAFWHHMHARLGGTETEALLKKLDAGEELYRGTRDPDTSV